MTGSKLSYDLVIWSWCHNVIIHVFGMHQKQRYTLSMSISNDDTYSGSWKNTINSIPGVPLETIRQQVYDY